jgi:hypothetical protein
VTEATQEGSCCQHNRVSLPSLTELIDDAANNVDAVDGFKK